MRKLLALALVSLAVPAFAEKQVVVTDDDVWSLYTLPQLQMCNVGDENASLLGLGIGTMLNQGWSYGLGGRMLVSEVDREGFGECDVEPWDLYYGGLEVGYTYQSASLVHPAIRLLVGAGHLNTDLVDSGDQGESFTVIEPQLDVYINISESVELGLSAGHRWADGVDVGDFRDGDLTGWTASLVVRLIEL